MHRLLLVLPLVACSGDDGNALPVDAPANIDAPGPGPSVCLVPATYGAQGDKVGTPLMGMASTVSITIDAGPPRDNFFVKLVGGKGAFAGGTPTTGTFTLSGADLDFNNCGLCVNIIADIVAMQGPSKFYFATGGSVTITNVNPLAGSLSNVTFHEVSAAGAPTNSGCTTKIDSITFSAI
jgi:hypothetical protein